MALPDFKKLAKELASNEELKVTLEGIDIEKGVEVAKDLGFDVDAATVTECVDTLRSELTSSEPTEE